ncbi:glycoside hydrolase family 20 protein [Gigaspora margarita]|uniref:beta-N-acetylhexosaminidase n=1 Tax=Gigaspora margarita TaxID=4874 RepID=A0A8H4EHJ1_GIGMA|nr:glycoside hydrolase family 20 protein [Gigaspora margarita]
MIQQSEVVRVSLAQIEITDNLKKDQDDLGEVIIDWIYNKEMSEGILLGIDESYELIIPGNKDDNEIELIAHLKAPTVYGILYGLTTFSQLLYYDRILKNYFFHLHLITIDFPKFMHRGLLLDTSRNFYPIKEILKTMNVMNWNKMNDFNGILWILLVGQWIVDEYARARGIRVIPEFDMLGHIYSIAASMPEILYSAASPSDQLNQAIPETYTFLNELVPEIASYFTDKFYHTGGDEVNMNSWNHLLKRVTEGYSVQVWKNRTMVKQVVEKGYRVVTGSGDYWYLDCNMMDGLVIMLKGKVGVIRIKHGKRYIRIILYKSYQMKKQNLLLDNYEQKLWPRSSAAAEVLWSGPEDIGGNRRIPDKDTLKRLNNWRF